MLKIEFCLIHRIKNPD